MAVRVCGDVVLLYKRLLPLKRFYGGGQHLVPVLGFLFVVATIFGNDGMVTMHGISTGNPKVQVLVLRPLQAGLEASDPLNDVTAKHGDAWWADKIETQQCRVMSR